MVFVYITCKNWTEAKKVSRHLLEERLVACSNQFPIQSQYWWEGKIVDDKEVVLLAKTIKKHLPAIKKEVKRMHSYDLPCICMLDSLSTKEYEEWVKKEVR